jgi:FMN-dependent oxidoreductase (nitrilotriacetate monooxygenase family)
VGIDVVFSHCRPRDLGLTILLADRSHHVGMTPDTAQSHHRSLRTEGAVMSPKPFHMAWFTPFRTPNWYSPWSERDGREWMNGRYYADQARRLESACFDYMMFEDSIMVSQVYGGTAENSLRFATHAPKGDPVALMPFLAAQTSRIGLIATMSTSFWEPYNLARIVATTDHLSQGRSGWNVVTSSEEAAAQNLGRSLAEHDTRYEQAEEFIEIAKQLWASWEDDAIVMDYENNIYADYTKVHEINYVGKFFSSRGPLNIPAGPQGQPVICQAGGSPRGMDFAAQHADTILTNSFGIPAMRAYRDGIRVRMEKFGRNPDHCKVMFVIDPVLGASEAEAIERAENLRTVDETEVQKRLGSMSITSEIDFSQFALDEPFPDEVTTNGHQSMLEAFKARNRGKTLREAIMGPQGVALELFGTPDQVADQMGAAMEEVGGDGFLIRSSPNSRWTNNGQGSSRHYIEEVVGGLVPALQRRGLMRTEYKFSTLRENLREF